MDMDKNHTTQPELEEALSSSPNLDSRTNRKMDETNLEIDQSLKEATEKESTSPVHRHPEMVDSGESSICSPTTGQILDNLEDRRKLEIRLSRLPEKIAPGTEERMVEDEPESSLSSSPSSSAISTSEGRSPKRKSPQRQQPKNPKSEGLATRRHIIQSRKRATALKRKKPSTAFIPVKIKMNFLTRNLGKRLEEAQKSKREIEFETKERDAAAAAAEASKRILESRPQSAFPMDDHDPRFSKPCLPSTPDGSSSSSSSSCSSNSSHESSEDEYDYRPMRASKAAALQAVVHGKRKLDSDSDTLKSMRNKFGNYSPKPVFKSKSRRSIMKRTLQKRIRHYSEDLGFGYQMCRSIFHNDQYYQAGDIVTIEEEEDEGHYKPFFAQITNLMRDGHDRDYVEIAWLAPNTRCRLFPFCPENYDRRDDFPRMTLAIEFCEYLMRLPEDFFTKSPEDHQLNPCRGAVYQRVNQTDGAEEDAGVDTLGSDEDDAEIKVEPSDDDEVTCKVERMEEELGSECTEIKVQRFEDDLMSIECKEENSI